MSSTFMDQVLPPPILNVSAFWIGDPTLYNEYWVDPRTQQRPFDNISQAVWQGGGQTYDASDLAKYGSCQPLKVFGSSDCNQ